MQGVRRLIDSCTAPGLHKVGADVAVPGMAGRGVDCSWTQVVLTEPGGIVQVRGRTADAPSGVPIWHCVRWSPPVLCQIGLGMAYLSPSLSLLCIKVGRGLRCSAGCNAFMESWAHSQHAVSENFHTLSALRPPPCSVGRVVVVSIHAKGLPCVASRACASV